MSQAIENLNQALAMAFKNRPSVGGFPYLAECLRAAGVVRNIWTLPGAQSVYLTKLGNIVSQGESLVNGTVDIPTFSQSKLIEALRADQSGKSTFPEFLQAAWQAGVVKYEVDFENRNVVYFGVGGENYTEAYAQVKIT